MRFNPRQISMWNNSMAHTSFRAMTSTTKEGLAGLNNLKGETIFVRLDLNVPLSKEDGKTITDDTRIVTTLPTINYLTERGAKVVIAAHFGRPKGQVVDSMRLDPIATRLSELVSSKVIKTDDCIGSQVKEASSKMKNGEILLLENVRFHQGETKNDPAFAEALAKDCGATAYVNDAFGAAHRAHASTAGIISFINGPHVAGKLMQKEVEFLYGAVENPATPLAAVIGGAKVSTKLPVLESLIPKCDKIFIGGGMIFTFYKANGLNVGGSIVEDEQLELALQIQKQAVDAGCKFILPTDVICADKFAADAAIQITDVNSIPDDWLGLDIGPDSLANFKSELQECKTIIWNGPMGVFEFPAFSKGTYGVAETLGELTDKGAMTVIGGGDSVAAVKKAGLASKMSHVSTGGGASLEVLEGKILPGVAGLDDK
jgi:phosphoglycerate kinase